MQVDREQLRDGNDEYFAGLVNEYSPRLMPYLGRYAHAGADVHDLLQDVWLRVYEKRATFDGRGSFFGWLLMVARTVGMTAVRDRGREPTLVDLHDVAAVGDPDTSFLSDSLREAVLSLPDRQREVVILRLVEGMSTAETARRLQCAEGTVKATLHQATRKLREQLKEMVR